MRARLSAGNANYTGLRPVESENSPFVVGITRAYVPAFGLHSGPRDAHHSGRIFRFHGPPARVISTFPSFSIIDHPRWNFPIPPWWSIPPLVVKNCPLRSFCIVAKITLFHNFCSECWECRNPTGLRPVGSKNSPFVVGITLGEFSV